MQYGEQEESLLFLKAICGIILNHYSAGQDVSLIVKTAYFMNVSWGWLSSTLCKCMVFPCHRAVKKMGRGVYVSKVAPVKYITIYPF